MQSPSNSQKKAINHGQGPMLVLAGPGSGKTFVIIQRILNLIHVKHIQPEHILVISFSKASTLELKQRFQKQISDSYFKQIKEQIIDSNLIQTKEQTIDSNLIQIKEQIIEPENKQVQNKNRDSLFDFQNNMEQVNFMTFHACFFQILRETYHYTAKDIITEKQKRTILQTVLANPNIEEEKQEEYLHKISYYKNKDKRALSEEMEEFKQIFQNYNREMHSCHKLDFDDMGLLCLQLFQKNPEILEKWQNKYQYILIDEFQDINTVQFKIIQMLVGMHKNIFVVGDDDQSIYGFRGANPQIMLDFETYFPDTKKVLLETNYRCSENIVKEALKVIAKNKVRFQKAIRSAEKKQDKSREESVLYRGFEDYHKEYSYIKERIKDLVNKEGVSYSDIACIFRTNQDMSGLAEYFARQKLPFVMKEACNSVYQHFIAKDILAYLQFFLDGKKRSDFVRIMNKPVRYLSRSAFSDRKNEIIHWKQLKYYYAGKNYMLSMIEQLEKHEQWISSMDLYGAVLYIRKVIGYERYVKENTAQQKEKWEEYKEILEFLQESTRNVKSLEEWKNHIEQYEEALKYSKEEKNGVHLITMHACKGLEYSVVFLPDCNEGKIPHKKAVTSMEVEEERRMFYVAMTRAKRHLEILYIEDKQNKHLQPTRFMDHLKNKNKYF